MTSINTLSANSAVLTSLRQTNADLATSQSRIASGYKVASARDNASVWATAQSIRTDLKAQDTVDGSIALAKGKADAAIEALTSIQTILSNLSTAAAGAVDFGVTGATAINAAVQANVKNYQNQLKSVISSAAFQGSNLLTAATAVTATIGQDSGTPITLSFTPSLVILDAAGTAGILGTGAGTASSGSGAASTFDNIYTTVFNTASTTTNALRDTFIATITAAQGNITTVLANTSNYSNSLGTQQDFNKKITDIRNTALGALVDANMEDESAKVQALQVKQQLAYQALSIGNSAAQNILRLFQ